MSGILLVSAMRGPAVAKGPSFKELKCQHARPHELERVWVCLDGWSVDSGQVSSCSKSSLKEEGKGGKALKQIASDGPSLPQEPPCGQICTTQAETGGSEFQ